MSDADHNYSDVGDRRRIDLTSTNYTMDQELETVLLAGCICTLAYAYALTRWQHFSAWNDVVATVLKA